MLKASIRRNLTRTRAGRLTILPMPRAIENCSWYREQFREVASIQHPFPSHRFDGKGVVIGGGGLRHYTCAWVCVNLLRWLGCELPIEVWYLGPAEMSPIMRALLTPLGVTCIDATEVNKRYPARYFSGWALKPYAIMHSRFSEVLWLDADNVPVVNPAFLFDTSPYRSTGAAFFADQKRHWLGRSHDIWYLCNIPYRDEPAFESGQIVVDKARCWDALRLTMHMNEYADFYYRFIYGDKDTFHMAWRKLGQRYAMPSRGMQVLPPTVMCHHDFEGRRIFQHRACPKWTLSEANRHIDGFQYEAECLAFLQDLKNKWWLAKLGTATSAERQVYEQVQTQRYYRYSMEGFGSRILELLPDFTVGQGGGYWERLWEVKGKGGIRLLGDDGTTCEVEPKEGGRFAGRLQLGNGGKVALEPLVRPKRND